MIILLPEPNGLVLLYEKCCSGWKNTPAPTGLVPFLGRREAGSVTVKIAPPGRVDEKRAENLMKYYIWTEGCQMNVADSQRLASALEQLGYEEAPLIETADVIILNTCMGPAERGG